MTITLLRAMWVVPTVTTQSNKIFYFASISRYEKEIHPGADWVVLLEARFLDRWVTLHIKRNSDFPGNHRWLGEAFWRLMNVRFVFAPERLTWTASLQRSRLDGGFLWITLVLGWNTCEAKHLHSTVKTDIPSVTPVIFVQKATNEWLMLRV